MIRRVDWEVILEKLNYIELQDFFRYKGCVNPIVVLQYLERVRAFKKSPGEAPNNYRIDPIDAVWILNLLDICVSKGIIAKNQSGGYELK